MAEKTTKQLAFETHQAVFGVPDTEEKGMVGDIKDIKELIIVQNGRYQSLRSRVNWIIGVLTGVGFAGGAIFGAIQLWF